MVDVHLIDVHILQLCINLKYNDFLLFSDELQLNILIMLICYALKLICLTVSSAEHIVSNFIWIHSKTRQPDMSFPLYVHYCQICRQDKQNLSKNHHKLDNILQLQYTFKHLSMEYTFISVDI
jgi:hypothetical protein